MGPVAALGLQFGLQALGGIFGSSAKKKQAYNDRTAGLQQEAASYADNEATNQAIGEANLKNRIRTGYRVGLLNVQQAQAKKRAMEQGMDLTKNAAQVLGAANANAAAAGTVGASVDAVIQDINMQVSDAREELGEEFEITAMNFDTELTDLLNAGMDATRSAQRYTGRATPQANMAGTSIGESILGAAINVGGSYFSQKMALGLGAAPPKLGGASNVTPVPTGSGN